MVYQGLIADVQSLGFPLEMLDNVWIQHDRDAVLVTLNDLIDKSWPLDSPESLLEFFLVLKDRLIKIIVHILSPSSSPHVVR